MKKDITNSFQSKKGMGVTFEELHLRHINLLIDIKNKELNNWFLKMAIINTFDDLKIFLNNLKKNKNKCIIAKYGNEIIGYLNIFPLNKKETCLKITKHKLINNECSLTDKQLTLGLIKKSISIKDIKTSSWIINSDINNVDLISTSRELGFQPLGEIILWDGSDINKPKNEDTNAYTLINEFQDINKQNILKIVNFIRSTQSPLIRNILDFDQDDILKRNNSKSGALIYENSVLCTILKEFIKRFFEKSPVSYLKTYKENSQLNLFLEECNLKEKNQEIILIRNTIVKNEAKQVNIINQSLESIIEKLSPQGNPYPSPFPLKTK